MKFTCYKSDLVEALQMVIRFAAVKPMTPIFSGIYLKAEKSSLELQANNVNTAIKLKIPVSTETDGEVVIVGKRLQDFVRSMPEDTVTFSDNGNADSIAIESGGAKAELMSMSAAEFPKIKVPDTDKVFQVRATSLKSLIRKTIFAASKDDERPVFRGCSFKVEGDRLTLAATNMHRIAIASDVLRDNYEDGNFIVPPETLRAIMNYIDASETENFIEVKYSYRNVSFEFNNVYVTSRLTEGEFPTYEKFFNFDSTTLVTVNKTEFRGAVDFISLVSKESEYKTVTFDINSAGSMIVSASSPDIGTATKPVDAEVKGELMEISFNAEYILDVLRVMDEQRVQIELKDKFDTAVIREKDNFIYVVTPVRT